MAQPKRFKLEIMGADFDLLVPPSICYFSLITEMNKDLSSKVRVVLGYSVIL
jgi:hypothetical protein